jgi:hypothetical protein
LFLACLTGLCPTAIGLQADTAVAPPAVVKPSLPSAKLAGGPEQEPEAEHLQTMARRAADLAQNGEQKSKPITRAEWFLAASNLILAYELEPVCSRALLELEGHEEGNPAPADPQSAVLRAATLLERADEELRKEPEGEEDPAERRRMLQRQLSTLQAFRDGLRAYLAPGQGEERLAATRRAASGLSVLLEDSDPRVAAAATLWQATLRFQEGDRSAALSILDLPLSKPPKEATNHGFFARLLRCRILADQGGSAASVALLMQMEEQCEGWFREPAERDAAVRTAGWVQMGILGRQFDRLTEPSQQSARQGCADRMNALIRTHFDGEVRTLSRLNAAIPIIAEAPSPNPATGTTPDDG